MYHVERAFELVPSYKNVPKKTLLPLVSITNPLPLSVGFHQMPFCGIAESDAETGTIIAATVFDEPIDTWHVVDEPEQAPDHTIADGSDEIALKVTSVFFV